MAKNKFGGTGARQGIFSKEEVKQLQQAARAREIDLEDRARLDGTPVGSELRHLRAAITKVARHTQS